MDFGPFLFNDETAGQTLLYYSSDRPGGAGKVDIYVSRLSSETGTFEPPVPIAELNTNKNDFQPTLRKDGLEIFFVSGGPTGYFLDLWTATRETTLDSWSTPVNLTLLNITAYEYHPTLSWDGTTLIFMSRRDGTADLFMSTRTRLHTPK